MVNSITKMAIQKFAEVEKARRLLEKKQIELSGLVKIINEEDVDYYIEETEKMIGK